MTLVVLNGLVLLSLITKCLAGLNLVSLISDLTSRPLQQATTDTADFIQIASKNGYNAQKHNLTTDDGYILTMYRIPPGENCTKKTPILLMHGLLQEAEGFVDSGPKDAVGYVLAQECYDVWFGNVRGTYNSRKHIYLNPDKDLKFWKFSVDEMGQYDVPAMIDYVLNKTDTKKLIYIGYSQGGASFFIMNSERPEYADKISLFIGFAPSSRHYNTKSVVFRTLATSINALQDTLEDAGVWEVLSKGMPIQGALSILCDEKLLAAVVCGLATSVIDSPHPNSITPETLKNLIQHAPAGTSIQNLARYGQAMNNLKFVKFDYGCKKNLAIYGCPEPPEYDLKAVKVPSVIFQGLSDHIVDPQDEDWVVSQLPNVLEYIKVKDPLWNHLDMAYSRNWKQTIFARMKKYLDKYN